MRPTADKCSFLSDRQSKSPCTKKKRPQLAFSSQPPSFNVQPITTSKLKPHLPRVARRGPTFTDDHRPHRRAVSATVAVGSTRQKPFCPPPASAILSLQRLRRRRLPPAHANTRHAGSGALLDKWWSPMAFPTTAATLAMMTYYLLYLEAIFGPVSFFNRTRLKSNVRQPKLEYSQPTDEPPAKCPNPLGLPIKFKNKEKAATARATNLFLSCPSGPLVISFR